MSEKLSRKPRRLVVSDAEKRSEDGGKGGGCGNNDGSYANSKSGKESGGESTMVARTQNEYSFI
jgi:hypothetical protein